AALLLCSCTGLQKVESFGRGFAYGFTHGLKIDWQTDIKRACQSAYTQRKPLVLYVFKYTCHACNNLDQYTWSNRVVGSLSMSAVYTKLLTIDELNNTDLSELLGKKVKSNGGVTLVPATIVFTCGPKQATEKGRIIGYYKPLHFYSRLRTLIIASSPDK
ncbi:MAG: DUF255 domain-containing protein, partial [Candidatus Eremiobacteraeota bacterium]|nr:DUF255 domain-containing protein [Candidatus Eremiobacteraeota bacterium]